MAAYRWVYDPQHLQDDCQEKGSALGNRVWATFTFLLLLFYCYYHGTNLGHPRKSGTGGNPTLSIAKSLKII